MSAIALSTMIENALIDRDTFNVEYLRQTLGTMFIDRTRRKELQDKLKIAELAGTVFNIRKLFAQDAAWRRNDNEIHALPCSDYLPTIAIASVTQHVARFGEWGSFRCESMQQHREGYERWINVIARTDPKFRYIPTTHELRTAVPFIPKNLMPRFGTRHRHVVLFDVPKWTGVRVYEDPYILERISDEEFRVVSHWDLSENEKDLLRFAQR